MLPNFAAIVFIMTHLVADVATEKEESLDRAYYHNADIRYLCVIGR